MKTERKFYNLSKDWIYRNARPVDFARWQYHFEDGPVENVLAALDSYQNTDGGFAHALEADSWNPNSSPIQTWAATEILREININDKQNGIVQGILRYLDSGKDFFEGAWQCTVPTNNDYPHAPWWQWVKNNRRYNPTASLCGFIVKFADKNSDLFSKGVRIAKEAVEHFLLTDDIHVTGDGHVKLCYLQLKQYCEEANEIDIVDFTDISKKILNSINIDDSNLDWCCDGIIHEFIKTFRNDIDLISSGADIVKTVCDYMVENQQSDGTWNIPWGWNDYQEQWAISKNWWKAGGIIGNMLFLKQSGYIK